MTLETVAYHLVLWCARCYGDSTGSVELQQQHGALVSVYRVWRLSTQVKSLPVERSLLFSDTNVVDESFNSESWSQVELLKEPYPRSTQQEIYAHIFYKNLNT